MTITAYMVIGCPGSGKSWVCEQLAEQFHYVRHDSSIGGDYFAAIKQAATVFQSLPLLIETPFSISQIKDPLEEAGFRVVPVFILEQPEIIAARYEKREGKAIPSGHLSRQVTYTQRAQDWCAFSGTSAQVLQHLKSASAAWMQPIKQYPWE